MHSVDKIHSKHGHGRGLYIKGRGLYIKRGS